MPYVLLLEQFFRRPWIASVLYITSNKRKQGWIRRRTPWYTLTSVWEGMVGAHHLAASWLS